MKKNFFKSVFVSLLLFGVSCTNDSNNVDYSSKPESITALRKVKVEDNLKFQETSIKAVVVNDPSHGNFESTLLAVQQEGKNAAILLELTNAVNYEVGDEVLINLNGSTLHYVDNELRVKNLSAVNVSKTGKKIEIQPYSTDLPTIVTEIQYWGPILVEVKDLVLTDGNTILGGENTIDDGIIPAKMTVLNSADFYDEEAPEAFDKIVGIARIQNDVYKIYPRSMDDLVLSVTELKEDFEKQASTSYDQTTLSLATGDWLVSGGLSATTASDLKYGAQSIRLQGTIGNTLRKGILEMKFDVKGVKTIKLSHGIYPASSELTNVNPTTLDLEYSIDGGLTYQFIKTLIVNTNVTSTTNVFKMEQVDLSIDPTKNVRFRLVNSSTPFANNNKPRINIDDFIMIF